MPTLIALDGFAHQTAATAQAGSGFTGTYNTVNGTPTFDTSNKRTSDHVASLKLVMDGVTTQAAARDVAAGNRLLVASFYIRVTTAPSVNSQFYRSSVAGGPAMQFFVLTTGVIRAQWSGATAVDTSGTYADSAWHRIDFRLDTSGTTYTADWAVDGVAQTQATRPTSTANDLIDWRLGSSTNTHTLTVWYQDFVLSATTGDYPIGNHRVLPLYPNADGTHVIGSTNAIRDDANGTTNLYQKVDDWNGGTPSTADFVHYTSTATGDAASNYAEFAFTDPTQNDIWDVGLVIAGFANGTGADSVDTRLYTAHAGTLIDSIAALDFSGSTTVLGYHRKLMARPSGGWTNTNLTNVVAQWGYATDTNAIPRISAVMLEYASADDVSITTTTVAQAASVPAPTVSAEASITTTTVARAAAIPTPDVEAESAVDADITPTPVAVAVALDTPITTGEARAPPATVGAVAAVPTPGIETSSDAAVTATTVAVEAAIPAPTVEAQANAEVTTATVEVAAVLDATVSGDVAITVTTVAVLQGEPGAYISIDASVEFRDAPENLLAVPVSTTQIDLSWDAVGGASVYDIERDGSVIVTNLPALVYSDTGLAPNSTHYYRVRAAG